MHGSNKYWIISLLLLFTFLHLKAQETLSFGEIDQKTYELYEAKQWKELEQLSKLAFKNGIDYYYLRLRTGIAAFEQKKYREAIDQFKKALSFNSDDNLSYEYLYYCYLYTNREDEALKLSRQFSDDFASYMKTKKQMPVTYITAEAGAKLSDSIDLFKPATYAQLALNHTVNRQFSLYHALNYYKQNESRFSVQQMQYYIRATLPLKKNLLLAAGAHVFFDDTHYSQKVVVQYTVQDPPPHNGGNAPPPRTTSSVQTQKVNELSLGFAGGFTLTKHLSIADISLGSTVLLLDTASQYQLNAGIIYYPFKNNVLGIGGNCYLHTENNGADFHFAYAPTITARIYKGFYLNASYFANQGLNITEQTASFINNSYDYTLQRFCLSPSFAISRLLTVYGSVGVEEKKHVTDNFRYHYTIFSFGLRINPFINHS